MNRNVEIREHKGIRYLHLGSDTVQGAMRLKAPWKLELAYTRVMLQPLQTRTEPLRQVLIIGLGAASQLKYLYRHYPDCQIDVVEIDPAVVLAARQYFHLPQDDVRIRLVIADGAEFIRQCQSGYDLIVVDGFDGQGGMGKLQETCFYQQAWDCLNENGLLSANLGASQTLDWVAQLQQQLPAGRITPTAVAGSGNQVLLIERCQPVHHEAADSCNHCPPDNCRNG